MDATYIFIEIPICWSFDVCMSFVPEAKVKTAHINCYIIINKCWVLVGGCA